MVWKMSFDIRYRSYIFKHSLTEKPEMDDPLFSEHFHTSYELLHFVSGDAELLLQHTRYSIHPRSLLVIKPGEYHNIVFHSTAPYERYVIRVSPDNLHRNLSSLLSKTKSVYSIADTPLEEEFLRMDRHLELLRPEAQVNACIGSMDLILSYLISSEDLIRQADFVNETSKRILDYIDTHLGEIRTVDDLALGLHMSRSALYRVFSSQFHTPIISYIRTQQCLLAQEYIREGMPAQEAAERLGFTHYSSFYREYTRVFHVSPNKHKP